MLKVWMLNDEIPLGIVHFIIEICDCDFDSPVFFVVNFNMPMHSDRTHMVSTLNKRCVTVS